MDRRRKIQKLEKAPFIIPIFSYLPTAFQDNRFKKEKNSLQKQIFDLKAEIRLKMNHAQGVGVILDQLPLLHWPACNRDAYCSDAISLR